MNHIVATNTITILLGCLLVAAVVFQYTVH